MTDETPAPTRAFVRYSSRETDEVSLPGYLNPRPTIVTPGDVFSIDADQLQGILARGRFEEADAVEADASPNESMTKVQLGAKLEAAGYQPAASHTKAELVELADEYDKTHPTPPGPAGDNTTEGPTA